MKSYFKDLNLEDSRIKFRERCKCLSLCRTSHPSDINNIRASFECFHCQEVDTNAGLHWVTCSSYAHLCLNKNLHSDAELCDYYKEIINMRKQDSSQ